MTLSNGSYAGSLVAAVALPRIDWAREHLHLRAPNVTPAQTYTRTKTHVHRARHDTIPLAREHSSQYKLSMRTGASPESRFIEEAIKLAVEGVSSDLGGPFGAVVVRDGKIVGCGSNRVISSNDPTAHAEIVAIRDACKRLGTFHLKGCDLYASCEPCPMCAAALYWARVDHLFYAACREDATKAGFDDENIYAELGLSLDERALPMIRVESADVGKPFEAWKAKADALKY